MVVPVHCICRTRRINKMLNAFCKGGYSEFSFKESHYLPSNKNSPSSATEPENSPNAAGIRQSRMRTRIPILFSPIANLCARTRTCPFTEPTGGLRRRSQRQAAPSHIKYSGTQAGCRPAAAAGSSTISESLTRTGARAARVTVGPARTSESQALPGPAQAGTPE